LPSQLDFEFKKSTREYEAIGIESERIGDDLQRDVAPELCVTRPIYLTHPAHAEGGDDFIGAETSTGCESHRYFVGTRRFSSSVQYCTTMICGAAEVWSAPPLID
jgi:hypothetical protein